MVLLLVSFVAGALTVLAPCILPLLPVVVGSAASGRGRVTTYTVIGSLAVSILAFTFLLKVSTAFIAIPQSAWAFLSGGILIAVGLSFVFPSLWERIGAVASLSRVSNAALGAGYRKRSFWGDVVVGAALGPVFSTCSPTYFVILASVLPASFLLGTAYLLAYVAGLSVVLLLLAFLGDRFAGMLLGVSDARGVVKRSVGVLFIVLGVLIATGYEKKIETAIIDTGYFDVTSLEHRLLDSATKEAEPEAAGLPRYQEVTRPSGFVHSEPFMLKDVVGQKVILLDFMTYSCINCRRTFPYLVSWDERYRDEGLLVVGIHTPEFAFEKDSENVRRAMKEAGITFPIVLDNEYGTWRAYGNQYWPRKYLIDIHGNIAYDHIGEGSYEETEAKIRALLAERASVLGKAAGPDALRLHPVIPPGQNFAGSPETYFGALRNEYLGNGSPGRTGVHTFSLPVEAAEHTLYLSGEWNITDEYAEARTGGSVRYRYAAKSVYLVMAGDGTVEVLRDGVSVGTYGGANVSGGMVRVRAEDLYHLVEEEVPGEHTLDIIVRDGDVRCYAFTFG